jgi:hypothetical protein
MSASQLQQLPILKYLPMDIVNIIISFYGVIKLRNGKHMLQIDTDHKMYDSIKENFKNKIHTIPQTTANRRTWHADTFLVTSNMEMKHLYWEELTGNETIHFWLSRAYLQPPNSVYIFSFIKENIRMALYKKIYPDFSVSRVWSFRREGDFIEHQYAYY